MKPTILLSLLLAGWGSCGRLASKVANKRGIFADGHLYGTHGYLAQDHNLPSYVPVQQQPSQKYLFHADVSPVYYDTTLHHPTPQYNFGSFLPSLQDSTYQFHLPSYQPSSAGYSYPVPTGPKFEDGINFNFPSFSFDGNGVPDSFEILIESALRKPQIPDPRQPPNVQPPPRRILTNTNQHLFYRYPGFIPDSGLRVRVPLNMARPTRLVVPQHGAVAFGSGGLGYSTLPGGRLAIGSGSVGIVNVAAVRANLLPPNPQATAKPPARGFIQPQASVLQPQVIQSRSFDENDQTEEPPINDDKTKSNNSYTVFQLPEDQKNSTMTG